mgnify:CR=1 FL=1|tara:strand:- start:1205 stop:1756 length:552 start_codon:yes stop_codon:yes gene_type:complete
METSDWVLVGATVVGPILAVMATRVVDYFREKSTRRYNVFVGLMTTRAIRLNFQHIEALNRVEVEFSNVPEIASALKRYMDLLDDPTSENDDGNVLLIRRRKRAFAELVQAIGLKLRRTVDKLDLTEGGYYPAGLAELERLQNDNTEKLNEVLNGRPIRIITIPSVEPKVGETQRGPFPPRPD